MCRPELVPVGRDDECSHAPRAAPEEWQEIERGLVRPVNVFEYGQGRRALSAQLGEQGSEEFRASTATRHHLKIHVEHWAQRARGRQRVAAANQYPRTATRPLREPRDECGFADTGLAANEDEAAITGGGLTEEGVQAIQLVRALKQLHRLIIARL